MDKPFWETTYKNLDVPTFSKGPTVNVQEFAHILKVPSLVLDVGCGEGRNTIYLAQLGHITEGFDLSQSGIDKAHEIAVPLGLNINFWQQDLGDYVFNKEFDVILSHGVLHLPEKVVRDAFLTRARRATRQGGYHFIGVFTNRLPATLDNAPFTKSPFDVGELPAQYSGWEIIHHLEGTFSDIHPGGIHHEHAYERIIAKKL